MKFILLLLFIAFSNCLQAHSFYHKQSGMSSIEITGDTVYANGSPYCILTVNEQVNIIRTLDKQSLVYIQPVMRGNKYWYRIAFAPLNTVYYTPYSPQYINNFLYKFIKHRVIEDGYFSAYGANMLIKEAKEANAFTEEWELPNATVTEPEVFDWNISWKATTDKDSMIILKDGVPFAYYVYRHWKSYGVDSWSILKSTKAQYRYFIYKLDHTPMAEVRVADGWQTQVKILANDGKDYMIKDVPLNKDFMTIAVKLLLAREEQKQ